MQHIGKSLLTLAFMAWIAPATPASADTIDLIAIADGEAVLNTITNTTTLGSTTQAFNTSQNITVIESRGVYEFDLPLLTDPIVSATFLGSVTLNAPATNTLSFYGHSGNGTLEAADAVTLTAFLGSATVLGQPSGGGAIPISVSLDPSFIQTLGAGFLGLTTTVGSGTVLVASLETPNASFQKPTLQLVTEPVITPPTDGVPQPPAVIPEPATLILLGSGLAAAARHTRRRQQREC